MKEIFKILLLFLLFGCAQTVHHAKNDYLTKAIYDSKLWQVLDKPYIANNTDALYKYMNGGTDFYIKHGFIWAIFWNLKSARGGKFNLEIYHLNDKEHTLQVLKSKKYITDMAINVGDEAYEANYYLLFRIKNYFVSVVSLKKTKYVAIELQEIAREVNNILN